MLVFTSRTFLLPSCPPGEPSRLITCKEKNMVSFLTLYFKEREACAIVEGLLAICPPSSPLLYWLCLCSSPWLFVEKMKRSSWQRRKSLSSSKSSILFCSHEFFSSEICSWVRRLVITMYELLIGEGPADEGVSSRVGVMWDTIRLHNEESSV